MRTVWDSLAENSVLLHPPNITSNTLHVNYVEHDKVVPGGQNPLVLVGGWSSRQLGTISDCWIGDLTTKQWKKV